MKRRFEAIAVMAADGLPVQMAARVLGVSQSGHYEFRSRGPSAREVRHAVLTDLIREVHTTSRGTYGIRRVHAELTLGRGLVVARGTVELLMHRAGVQGVTGRPRWRRPRPDLVAKDLVERGFSRTGPNQLWVTDITEHHTREGKVYCAVVLDVYARRVVGWSIDASPTARRWWPTPWAWPSTLVGHHRAPSSTRIRASSSGPGPSPTGPEPPDWCRRWAASGTASTTP